MLDLFAGSGQLGIEALSRGAAYAVFVDSAAASIACVKRNLQHTKLISDACILQTDSLTFLRNSTELFDIAFLDPPYSKGILQAALPLVAKRMNPGGVIICEHPYGEELPKDAESFSVFRKYKYGKTELTVYRRKEE